jgi:hypothetical protein
VWRGRKPVRPYPEIDCNLHFPWHQRHAQSQSVTPNPLLHPNILLVDDHQFYQITPPQFHLSFRVPLCTSRENHGRVSSLLPPSRIIRLSRGLGLCAGISELDSVCPAAHLSLPSDLPARGRLRYSQRTDAHCITQPTILLPSAPSPRPRTQLARIPAHHPLPCTIAPPCVALMTALELRSYLFAY